MFGRMPDLSRQVEGGLRFWRNKNSPSGKPFDKLADRLCHGEGARPCEVKSAFAQNVARSKSSRLFEFRPIMSL